MSADDLSDEQLRELHHNNHRGAFFSYLNQSRHTSDKQTFLRQWVQPAPGDSILECGSSSGKTSIDLARHSECFCLGVDFDPDAVAIASKLRDEHFPGLAQRCQFKCDDLTTMVFEHPLNKVLMPDFSEHIPDRVFSAILDNLRRQLSSATLYIYTPCGSHLFELMKKRNLLLKNPPGHINVKTRGQLEKFLAENGWQIEKSGWRRSSIPVVKAIESILGYVPILGRLFQRRIVLTARPATAGDKKTHNGTRRAEPCSQFPKEH